MKKKEAAHLVNQTFTQAFSEEQFVNFAKNLLTGMEAASTRTVPNAQLPQGYREHVHSYSRLGTYRDPKGNVLDVVVVKLKKRGSLDRARTRQRNLMAHYLNKRKKDAVLAAYVTDDLSDWRFSYVKLAYQTKITDKGTIKVEQDFTPARRYSFLVGEYEPNHTAQKQLGDLLVQEGKLSLEQIEEAFNIESVTKEFFEDYKTLFLQIKENLDQIGAANPVVKTEFERCEINTANFAKKLLGQIVFLYFLQKKGWLGVPEDEEWGLGDRKFLHNLFLENGNKNFFDDVLEPFFYEALAIERKDDYYPALQCKIPFLNGGLFEPLKDYDWEKTHINLNNQVFKEIFKVFNLYNFTVREDEPLEKEVAVDPEMLGKVFENLLEITDRKSKGAFYTPREIVHYMCQESLINYLDIELNSKTIKVDKEDVESFIRKGDTSLENDLAKEAGRKSGDYGLPNSVRELAREIDFALADVKICDPAIGSGAFPVGMMAEIVRARCILTPYITKQSNRDPYTFKWHCIESNLYGVDIDPSAVEIAKLRLWLSLVVDEDSYDQIRPLPNLDYRIVCGDSLESVKKDMFYELHLPEYEKKKDQYYGTTSRRNKVTLKKEIDELRIAMTVGDSAFDYQIDFCEVFRSNNGFDIVIGNPPYIGEKGNKELFRAVKKRGSVKDFYQAKMDYFYFFYHLAIHVLGNPNSVISMISTNYFITADGAIKLREDLKKNTTIIGLVNFGEYKVFDNAKGQHNSILIITLNQPHSYQASSICEVTNSDTYSAERLLDILNRVDPGTLYSSIEHENLFDGISYLIRMSGTQGGNWVSQITNKILFSTRRLGEICEIRSGADVTLSRITSKYIRDYGPAYSNGEGVFVLSNEEMKRLILSENEKEFIKPFIKNSDIMQFKVNKSKLSLIYTKWSTQKKDIPIIYNHLSKFKPILEDQVKRYEENYPWYALHRPREQWIFENPNKIVAPYRSKINAFSMIREPIYASRDVFFISTKEGENIDEYYLLGILNSKVVFYWLFHRGKRKGNTLELYQTPLSNIPIKKGNKRVEEEISKIVKCIISNKGGNLPISEEIDLLNAAIYSLYDMTEEEIIIIEESVGK